jgi:hypothetical protein
LWMSKVRPWYGHDDHIHVRLKCPADSPNCRAQPPVPGGDGCDKSLDHWFTDSILRIKIPEFGGSSAGLKLKDLPPACIAVLSAPASPASAGDGRSEIRTSLADIHQRDHDVRFVPKADIAFRLANIRPTPPTVGRTPRISEKILRGVQARFRIEAPRLDLSLGTLGDNRLFCCATKPKHRLGVQYAQIADVDNEARRYRARGD